MKSQKGISHIKLTICVLIIIIIVALLAMILLNENKNREIENLTTDMLLVQGKVKVVSQENAMQKEERPLVGKKVEDNLEDEKVKDLVEKQILNPEEEGFDQYYIIDSDGLIELNLQDNLDGEYYIVNYTSYEIIYTRGIEIDGKISYTLTELLKYRDEREAKKQKDKDTNTEESEVNEEVNEEIQETVEE